MSDLLNGSTSEHCFGRVNNRGRFVHESRSIFFWVEYENQVSEKAATNRYITIYAALGISRNDYAVLYFDYMNKRPEKP